MGCLLARHIKASDLELRKTASWKWPDRAQIDQSLAEFIDQKTDLAQSKEKITGRWISSPTDLYGPPLFDSLLAVLALSDSRLDRLFSQLDQTGADANSAASADLSWMDSSLPPWIQANVQLAVARAMANQHLYDESLQLLKGMDSSLVVDPSTWMFYQAVCHHHLLQRDDCLTMLNRLMEREPELVSRYAITARLMKSDIEPLKEDTLDEISRLMNDVERRLDLGRAGTRVREQEQQIVDKLDKMIEKIEEQIQQQQKQQQQQQQQSQDQKKGGQGKPMEESKIAGANGSGDVDQKSLNNKNSWGDLPPAQRQEALQNITKDLPSHYREVIEAYFKRLATGEP